MPTLPRAEGPKKDGGILALSRFSRHPPSPPSPRGRGRVRPSPTARLPHADVCVPRAPRASTCSTAQLRCRRRTSQSIWGEGATGVSLTSHEMVSCQTLSHQVAIFSVAAHCLLRLPRCFARPVCVIEIACAVLALPTSRAVLLSPPGRELTHSSSAATVP